MLNWESLQTACLSCTSCPLSQTRHNVVFGVGPTDAEILFVGEGPGEQEDLTGEPFVGPAGKLLDDMLRIIDLGRHNCYIANIVKCRPPHNRDPLNEEQAACRHWLSAQTDEAVEPQNHRLPRKNCRDEADSRGLQNLTRPWHLGTEGRHLVYRDVPPFGAPARCDQAPRYVPGPQKPAGKSCRALHAYPIKKNPSLQLRREGFCVFYFSDRRFCM